MLRAALLVLSLISLPAVAASGSWSDTQRGVTLQNRGVMMSSPPLAAANSSPVRQKGSATITTVSWKYELLGARPAGLQVQLCNSVNHCVGLDADSGVTTSFYGQAAISPMRFVYFVAGNGAMNTPLRVIGNQVIVNYR
ncbi:flagellar protein FlhE [Rahnella sp. PCH160]|uniref:flagellar protein FlhE n=1 Tax=Rahnella sp. PCH160 TaxID=3447928 RepID=UPI0039FCBD83